MTRFWDCGFELNSITANVELTAVTGAAATIVSTAGKVRSGVYCGKIASLSSGSRAGFGYQSTSLSDTAAYWYRFCVMFDTRPSAENTIWTRTATNVITGTITAKVTIDNTGVLRLYNATTQIGSASSALSTGVQYTIEVRVDRSPAAGSHVLEARIDAAAAFATASNLTINAGVASWVGGNLNAEAQTTGTWYFDDLAINDSTGSNDTAYPGIASLAMVYPNATGDNAQGSAGGSSPGTTAWDSMDQFPPVDATTYWQLVTDADIAEVNVISSATAGITGTVKHVAIGYRINRASNATCTIQARVKSQASGTTASSTAANVATTAWHTNVSPGPPKPYPLVQYTDPQGGGAWTTALIDTMQIGVGAPDATPDVWVTSLWAYVEYIPSTAATSLVVETRRVQRNSLLRR